MDKDSSVWDVVVERVCTLNSEKEKLRSLTESKYGDIECAYNELMTCISHYLK